MVDIADTTARPAEEYFPNRFWISGLLILVLTISLVGIFDHGFAGAGEMREAEIAREFLDSHHNLAIPMLDDVPFVEKPPLVSWTVALCLRIFGNHPWTARLPLIIFGWGTLLFTYLLGKSLYGKGVGFGSVLVLATTLGYFFRTHELEIDIGLLFFVTGAAYFLYRAFTASGKWYLLFCLFALGAFFSKGLIGLAFLGLLFSAWIIWNRTSKEILNTYLWLGIVLIVIPIALWFIELASDAHGNLLYFYLVKNQLERFFPTADYDLGHEEPFYYYLQALPGQTLPWLIILVVAIPWLWSQRHEKPIRFLLCWFIPGILFLSVAGTKRRQYLSPLLPSLTIMVAAWFYAKMKGKWLTVSGAIIGVLLIISYPLFIRPYYYESSYKLLDEKLSAVVDSDTTFYSYGSGSELAQGFIPWHTGKYFIQLGKESELVALSKQSNEEIAIIVYKAPEIVRQYFPFVWLADDLWVLANVPLELRSLGRSSKKQKQKGRVE